MGGLPESLFESELFGHVKGAFTDAKTDRIGRYELADGGTLFLDEIGNLPLKHQATLLRLLESGEFERLGSSRTRRADVRLICATNADLASLVRNGAFREDLYYRINTVPIHIPPLRTRLEDLLPLAKSFLEKYRQKYRKPPAHDLRSRYKTTETLSMAWQCAGVGACDRAGGAFGKVSYHPTGRPRHPTAGESCTSSVRGSRKHDTGGNGETDDPAGAAPVPR